MFQAVFGGVMAVPGLVDEDGVNAGGFGIRDLLVMIIEEEGGVDALEGFGLAGEGADGDEIIDAEGREVVAAVADDDGVIGDGRERDDFGAGVGGAQADDSFKRAFERLDFTEVGMLEEFADQRVLQGGREVGVHVGR